MPCMTWHGMAGGRGMYDKEIPTTSPFRLGYSCLFENYAPPASTCLLYSTDRTRIAQGRTRKGTGNKNNKKRYLTRIHYYTKVCDKRDSFSFHRSFIIRFSGFFF